MDLSAIARDDVFSAQDAARRGLGADALARRVAGGECVPLLRGYYAVRAPRDPRDAHRLRTLAAWRRYAGRAQVSHQSALVLQGLPVHDVDLTTVHLTHRSRRADRAVAGVRLHRARPGTPAADGDRVPTASAIVQSGLVGTPLTSLVAADAALRLGQVTRAGLDEAVLSLAGCRGIGPVRAALQYADARIESVAESLLAHTMRLLGIAFVPQQVVVTDRGSYRCDFRVAGTKVLVEVDGRVKYSSPEVLWAEKLREDALRRAGWVVVRFVWAEVHDTRLVQQRIDAAVALSRRAR